MLRLLSPLVLATSISLFTFGSGTAFAASDKPKCEPDGPFTCVVTGTHGGSDNECTPGSPGCNVVVTEKSNPAGNNRTDKCEATPKPQCPE
jgi:hypothetical protein